MLKLFESTKDRYIQLKGLADYDKLYTKICQSKALIDLCGISVKRGIPPTSGDFIYKATMMPSIYITFDNVKSTMAALIMLQIWDERVNHVYHFCSDDTINKMGIEIVSGCIMLY